MPETPVSDDTPAIGSYEQMLGLLADDEHLAAERYLLVRSKLVAYFEGRRISLAEDFADEVLHRTAQKISTGEQIDDIDRYVYGIARFVRLEWYRRRQSESLDDVVGSVGNPDIRTPEALRVMPAQLENEAGDALRICLRECLAKLSAENKGLLLDYYEGREGEITNIKHRKSLAQQLGKSTSALQKQICLLRQKVGTCTRECVANGSK